MPRNPTAKQVRYLLSDASPLTEAEKARLRREIHGKKLRRKGKKKGKKK